MNTHSIYFLLLAAVLNVLAFDQEDRATAAEAGGQLSQPDDRRAAPSFIWLESESAKSSFKAEVGDWGRPQFLSGGKWLHLSVDEGQVEKTVPDEGILLDYAFQSPKAGRYEVWNRVGFEFVRSPFEWRLDEGPWQKASPEALTVDLMEMGFWTEVAWLKMGEADLTAGEHDLQIRLRKTKNDKGQWQKVLYASDAICLCEGPFQPNSRFKPGESGRDSADQAAAKAVFQVPEAKPSERSSVNLGGVWEIARDDEQLPSEVAEPIHDLPKHPIWRAISVPGDKNTLRPDLLFAHRIWYRTRLSVPASMAGRAFYLDFPYNNLNTTIYVNGVYCGFEKNPFAPFQIDVTKGIKAGQTNEVWVGIRDAWYGRSADPARPLKLRKTFNYPLGLFSQGFQDMDYPVWNCPQSGILATPAFVAAGSGVYVADIFVKPSVAQQRLEAEAALNNTTGSEVSGEIRWEAVDDATGEVQHVFKPQPFKAAAGQTQTVLPSDAWTDFRLWWPDTPHLYRLRTTVAVNGAPADVKETLFGFREWRREGSQFTLNGVVWHLWADLIGEERSPRAWLAAYKRTNQRTTRLSTAGQAGHESRWLGLEPREALEFCDRNGVVVRRNTTLDGETIGYQFSESDPETRRQQNGSELKLALMKNWREQCVAQVKGERNHPSIQIWSLENEFAYINLINLLGNSPNMDRYEEEITKTHDAVMAADPTRSAMIDGGGATLKNTLGVHGSHYVATLDGRYPDLAYEPFVEGGGRGRWKWDRQRPRFIGEEFYASGINPADYAMWGGEIAFQGKAATREAIATCYRMLTEGYRWGGYNAAWQLWLGGEGGPRERGANDPRAVLVRQWDWTFGSSQKVKRTFGIFNDSEYPEAITFNRRLTVQGKEDYQNTSIHNVAPGTAVKFDEEILMPSVATRREGELSLTLSAGGKDIYHDTKAVSILPAPVVEKLAVVKVAVFDPAGGTAAFLRNAGLTFTTVTSLDTIPADAKVLVVGGDAIQAEESTSTRLAVCASQGRAVIVLDQSHPLKYQAIPAEMELAPQTKKNEFGAEVPAAEGRTAFIEDTSHPALRGLMDKDFFTWGPDLSEAQAGAHRVFRNAYVKPTRGGKSLIQCGPRLEYSALVEVPVGQGVMYLCQLDLGNKLAVNPVARHLLLNLMACAAAYKLEHAEVAAVIGDEQLGKAVDAIGLQYANADDALAAIADASRKIALVSATPANLKRLAGDPAALASFWQRGGALFLCGLTPAGLADYNRIVGVNHVIRPFTRERVTFPASRNPLTAGLTTGDIVMLSGKRIFDWTADEYVASDVFSYVVDLDELAPFAKSDFASYDKIVNGFVGSDGWPLIIDFEYPKDGKPCEINLDLPREERIVEYTHKASVNYNPTTRIALLFDGQDRVEYDLQPNGDAQTFAVDPPRPARRVTLQLAGWLSDPAKQPLIGIDNIWLKVARPPEWRASVKPLLNIGAMVQYVKGRGSVVLCNLNFQETEAVPVNKTKKRTILAAVLRNLNAPFSSGKTVIAGANLVCTPIDIHTKATTFKDERGWFGDKARTLRALPSGEHLFAGVKFNIYEMPTSPVPQVLMLGGNGIPGHLPEEITGIPIGLKADALFFLHTARLDRRRDDREREEKKRFELCRYVIHYADGQTAQAPIFCEIDIDNFQQREPRSLPGAQVAWTGKFDGSDESAVVYAKQWNNPRPGVEIRSVDLVYGKDKERGVPALLAVTAATAP
ncbi:MAG: glycoside hydrolase family 2 TIM barrel-domain containing protein [Limisphaerales bacterium]